MTAAIALVAAVIALRQYRISVNSRLDQARPFVVIDLKFLGALYVCVVVSNAGQTAARDIRFEWSERPIALDGVGTEVARNPTFSVGVLWARCSRR